MRALIQHIGRTGTSGTLALAGDFGRGGANINEINILDVDEKIYENLETEASNLLKNEGIARELVNRIQNIRKDSGFEVMDRVEITIQEDEKLNVAVSQNLEYIKRETLTEVLQFEQKLNEGTEIVFDDITSRLIIKKV